MELWRLCNKENVPITCFREEEWFLVNCSPSNDGSTVVKKERENRREKEKENVGEKSSSNSSSTKQKERLYAAIAEAYGYIVRSIQVNGKKHRKLASAREFGNMLHRTSAIKFLKDAGLVIARTGHGTHVGDHLHNLGALEEEFRKKFPIRKFALPKFAKAVFKELDANGVKRFNANIEDLYNVVKKSLEINPTHHDPPVVLNIIRQAKLTPEQICCDATVVMTQWGSVDNVDGGAQLLQGLAVHGSFHSSPSNVTESQDSRMSTMIADTMKVSKCADHQNFRFEPM